MLPLVQLQNRYRQSGELCSSLCIWTASNAMQCGRTLTLNGPNCGVVEPQRSPKCSSGLFNTASRLGKPGTLTRNGDRAPSTPLSLSPRLSGSNDFQFSCALSNDVCACPTMDMASLLVVVVLFSLDEAGKSCTQPQVEYSTLTDDITVSRVQTRLLTA